MVDLNGLHVDLAKQNQTQHWSHRTVCIIPKTKCLAFDNLF